jgi:hypothetical protein
MLYSKKYLFCLLISANAFAGKEQTEATVSALHDLAAMNQVVQTNNSDPSTNRAIPAFAAMVLHFVRPNLGSILKDMMHHHNDKDYIIRIGGLLNSPKILDINTIRNKYNSQNPLEKTQAEQILKSCFDELVRLLQNAPDINKIMEKFDQLSDYSMWEYCDKNTQQNLTLLINLAHLAKGRIKKYLTLQYGFIRATLDLINHDSTFDSCVAFGEMLNLAITIGEYQHARNIS